MPRTELSPVARADLDTLDDYIAQDDPDAADRLAARFHEAFARLAGLPLLGRPRPELGSDIRSFIVGNYVILYSPADTGIHVHRVLHGRRDMERLLQDES